MLLMKRHTYTCVAYRRNQNGVSILKETGHATRREGSAIVFDGQSIREQLLFSCVTLTLRCAHVEYACSALLGVSLMARPDPRREAPECALRELLRRLEPREGAIELARVQTACQPRVLGHLVETEAFRRVEGNELLDKMACRMRADAPEAYGGRSIREGAQVGGLLANREERGPCHVSSRGRRRGCHM